MTNELQELKKQIEDLRQEMKERIANVEKGSGNGTNEHDVSITDKLAATLTECKRLEIDSSDRIEQLKQEVEIRKLEVQEKVELEELKTKSKVDITKEMASAATWVTFWAAVATTTIFKAKYENEVTMKKIDHGEFD